jgi:hypothetical protein
MKSDMKKKVFDFMLPVCIAVIIVLVALYTGK